MTPGAYNNNFQMFQTPEYVAILNEMVHDARIIPLDGRPHGNIRQWKGDSRGHWEGNTLVVDTTNFKRETSLAKLEREHAPDRTLHAHRTPTRSSTNSRSTIRRRGRDHGRAVVPMSKSEDPIYEYACHEGNYAMAGILAGARADEKATQEAAKKGSK